MKRITRIISAVFLSLGLAFTASAADKKPIVIGNPMPFSGPMSMYGEGTAVGGGTYVRVDRVQRGKGQDRLHDRAGQHDRRVREGIATGPFEAKRLKVRGPDHG